MKKTLLTTALISGAVLGLGAMNSVSAANTNVSKDTEAAATFTAGGGTEPGDAGPLSITSATPSIDFGSNEISATHQNYLSSSDIDVNVTDLRGTFVGWTVKVSGTKLMSNEKVPTELKGATISLPDGVAKTVGDSSEEAKGITASATANVLDGGASIVASADNGTGETTTKYAQADIKLGVGGGLAHAAKYSTTLNWTLVDGITK
ncbi:WxL domain-containing protein [Dellaglioa algida]|uniref:Cell surface protein n=1 Tax=Dellaglioa algida TaxID=105612 RepID=A0A5C6M8A5_9LACO|nr:WxL domain-containing protein [Dellaglioa algida]MDK1717505.1 WxL domain-containing protein [Dellaglioa algida]MDK1720754.1 WxL domain-containing protein [Dellaglioa algida]MDK1722423.1 WxL domain-containing protein [Dellaglioa algida]MDK1724071.1 WxL domain-containing protein [Dellaglioa algida]MDK1725628.1 WxL domain-containing protein [Dellaglioa algida]